LRFVPGFDFTSDVEGSVGLAVRGISALEGKALVMIDGMPLNDLAYGNVLFGNREAVDLIERVEVIRGPGSTVYGGFAELAVVNIVTHPDVPVDRVLGSATYGQLPSTMGLLAGSALASHSFGDLHVRASVFANTGVRSDAPFEVLPGQTVDMASYSTIRASNISLAADYKGISAQFIYDDYRTDSAVPDDQSRALVKHHKNLYAALKWQQDLGKYINVSVFGHYQHQNPWEGTDHFAFIYQYYNDKPIDRFVAGAMVTVKPIDQVRILLGTTFTHDQSTANGYSDPDIAAINTYYNAKGDPTATLAFNNVAGFAEVVAFTPVVNVTAGARYDHHNVYGDSFVPRIALTKEVGHFHAKALFGQAFRTPTFENISYFPQVKPETATVAEVEAGYQPVSWLYGGINLFDQQLANTIVYQEVPNTNYVNAGPTGTHGLEAEIRLKGEQGHLSLGYSFYRAGSLFKSDAVTQFEVPGRPDLHLGIPAHKFTLRGSLKLTSTVSLNPSMVVYSERYGNVAGGADPPSIVHFDASVLFDLFLLVKDVGTPGFDLLLGVHDIFGVGYEFVPAYNAGVNAMPGPGREVMVRLQYHHDFVK
jgi:outer membrane cobalamin receptor